MDTLQMLNEQTQNSFENELLSVQFSYPTVTTMRPNSTVQFLLALGPHHALSERLC